MQCATDVKMKVKHVLLIERISPWTHLLTMCLEDHGCEVFQANDSTEAVSMLEVCEKHGVRLDFVLTNLEINLEKLPKSIPIYPAPTSKALLKMVSFLPNTTASGSSKPVLSNSTIFGNAV